MLGDHLKRVSIAESTKSSFYHGNNIQQNELQRRVRERIRDDLNFTHARSQVIYFYFTQSCGFMFLNK